MNRRRMRLLGASAALQAAAFAQEPAMPAPSEKTVPLPDGNRVSAVGMGSWRLATGRRPLEAEEAALRAGIELGMRLIDTAEYYSSGASEKLVGRAVAGQRASVFVMTKITPSNARSTRSIRHSFERSLKNLGIDTLNS